MSVTGNEFDWTNMNSTGWMVSIKVVRLWVIVLLDGDMMLRKMLKRNFELAEPC